MPLLFVYGSLKQGFANEHVNTARRLAGEYRTRELFPMFLLDEGEVPCLVAPPGTGHQVVGELYEASPADISRMDRLERIGEPGGYDRATIVVERFDVAPAEHLEAAVYVRPQHAIPASVRRIGPLAEYKPEHAKRFRWKGAD